MANEEEQVHLSPKNIPSGSVSKEHKRKFKCCNFNQRQNKQNLERYVCHLSIGSLINTINDLLLFTWLKKLLFLLF